MAKLTPEQAEKFLEYVSIDAETPEEFKQKFDEKFIPIDTHKTAIGKRMTDIDSNLLEVFKLIDPTISSRQLSKKLVEENLKEFKEKLSATLSEKDEAAKSGNDKKVNDLMKQLEDKDKSLHTYKEVNESLKSEYENFKNESEGKFKNYKINDKYNQLKSQISFVDNPDKFKMKGYEDTLRESYQFDLDESEQLIVKDREGNPVKNPTKAGHIFTPKEVMEMIAEEAQLIKKNNAQSFVIQNNNNTGKYVPSESRKLTPAYIKRMKEMGKPIE